MADVKPVYFARPKCDQCNEEMRNVITIEGKRRFQCVTWGCTNRRTYDQEGNRLGKDSGNPQAA